MSVNQTDCWIFAFGQSRCFVKGFEQCVASDHRMSLAAT